MRLPHLALERAAGERALLDAAFFRRLIRGPTLGAEHGRPDPVGSVRALQLAPRLAFGVNFE